MWNVLMVAAGGALGSVARYWVGTALAGRLGTAFPYGTFVVNVTGSFVIGYVLTAGTERFSLHPTFRLLLATGFLGGYTTFSAFEYETLRLVETGAFARAAANVVLSVALGLAGVWTGALLARAAPLPRWSAVLEAAAPREVAVTDRPPGTSGAPPAEQPATVDRN